MHKASDPWLRGSLGHGTATVEYPAHHIQRRLIFVFPSCAHTSVYVRDRRLSLILAGIRSCFDLTPPGIGFRGAKDPYDPPTHYVFYFSHSH